MIETIDEEFECDSVASGLDSGEVWKESECLSDEKAEEKLLNNENTDSTGPVDKDILQIYRNKQRILMEANLEKDRRLEELEKEYNHQNVQNKEGIYWLRLQLDTTRQEKNNTEQRLSELQTQLQKMIASRPPPYSVDDQTHDDGRDEKDLLISRLQNRIKKYENSFGVIENQMAMIESSSGEIINNLKKEIADLMEDRTKVELKLLNQLSDLDNETRRRQLEYALELESKDEKIEALRKGQQVSLCTVDNSSRISSEGNKSESLGYFFGTSSKSKGESRLDELLVHRLGGRRTELHRKIEASSNGSEDVRTVPNSKDDTRTGERIWEERHRIESSICRVKSVLESTNAAISNLKDIVESFNLGDNSDIEIEKEKMLSIHQSASLIHDQVKVSIALIELKLRNKFDCLKSDLSTGYSESSTSREAGVNAIEKVKNDALMELEKVEADFSRQVKGLEERVKADVMSRPSNQFDHVLENSKSSTEDTLIISRGVLHLLENELIQFAKCMQSKNEMVDSLKADLRRHKKYESHLQRNLIAALKGTSCSAASERSTRRENRREDSWDGNCNSKLSKMKKKHLLVDDVKREKVKSKPTTRRKQHSWSPDGASIDPTAKKKASELTSIKPHSNLFLSHGIKSPKARRKGMPDVSLRGGTDPLAPGKPIFPRHRDTTELSSSLPNACRNDILTVDRSILISDDSN
eukprot:jgi/Psemu1/6425/gm1.6425_g